VGEKILVNPTEAGVYAFQIAATRRLLKNSVGVLRRLLRMNGGV
jgi:hypothetical protein